MELTKTAMSDIGLQWNPKKCAVVHVKRGVHAKDDLRLRPEDTTRIPSLEGQ